ncbi:MAG: hypothetical protein IJJ24_03815 [Solobacterium sp.]|nr:hypothetical protein [Solobacterium sp.]
MYRNHIVTWFYGEHKGNESSYPSVGSNTTDLSFQVVYWKCVYDFFMSAFLTQKETEYWLFTNVKEFPGTGMMDGLDLDAFFRENHIHVVDQELSAQTPRDWYGEWRNQFYVFDILRFMSENAEGRIIIFDSDMFFRKDIASLFNEIEAHGAVTYFLGDADDVVKNGTSNLDMTMLYEKFYGEKPKGIVRYRGGEFIAVTQDAAKRIVREFEQLWPMNYAQYEKDEVKLTEEAHFLSMIYARFGYDDQIGNQYLRRIWTAAKFDTVQKEDTNLAIWHLPAEKKYGFKALYSWLRETPRTKDEYLAYLGRVMMIPGSRSLRRLRRGFKRLFVK